MYYTCEKCHINFNEAHVEQLLENFIYYLLEYDMAVKKFFLPILENKNSNINIKKLDKEIQELKNQRVRIKDAYIKGIVKSNDFEADYKLIEDKLANLETQKLELINLETFNYSPHELLAERDLEREKMIRLDTLNGLLKSKWNGMSKEEKQEFIAKFIDTIELKKDNKGNLLLEKINYEEYKNLMGKRENLWKQYRRAKTEEDKSKILTEINDIQPKIKELRKYDKYCKNIKEKSEFMQNNLDNFDKDIQKEKDNSRSL